MNKKIKQQEGKDMKRYDQENKEQLIIDILWNLENGMPLGVIDILEKLGATTEQIKKAEKFYDEL